METANDKLQALTRRVVRVEFTDGSYTVGRLTGIKAGRLTINDGTGEAVSTVPHAIVLDHEDAFTHALTSVRRIDLAALDRPQQVRRVDTIVNHEQAAAPIVTPTRVVKFVESTEPTEDT